MDNTSIYIIKIHYVSGGKFTATFSVISNSKISAIQDLLKALDSNMGQNITGIDIIEQYKDILQIKC